MPARRIRTTAEPLENLDVAAKLRRSVTLKSMVGGYTALEAEALAEIERLRAAVDRALAYLEGEAPGVTSGGVRNSELRDELIALRESR